jgi:hypothetical protein
VARKKGVVSGWRERPKKRGEGTVLEKVYSAKAGDVREIDACMDGQMYQGIMLEKGVPATQRYFSGVAPETMKKIKEDGAPGHGYNNHEWPLAPSATHRVLERCRP